MELLKPTNANSQRGATLVELTIAFPVFLAIIFLLIFVGVVYNARNSLTSSVGNAVRLAFTRGDRDLVGKSLIEEVQIWLSSGGAPTPRIKELLAAGEAGKKAFGPAGYYDIMARKIFGTSFQRLPPRYIYALIIAYQGMREGVGSTLQYPCDEATLMGKKGPGCVECRLLNASSKTDRRPSSAEGPQYGSAGYNMNWVGLKCAYRPDNVLIRPIEKLLAVVTGNDSLHLIRIERSKFFETEQNNMSPL